MVVASSRTDEVAREAGLEVVELDGSLRLALAIDGADEVDPELGLLKGGGGALLREKIVIHAAEVRRRRRDGEAGGAPGQHARIPVEVVRFGWRATRASLLELVESAELRRAEDDEPYVTDESHYILDYALAPKARWPTSPRQ